MEFEFGLEMVTWNRDTVYMRTAEGKEVQRRLFEETLAEMKKIDPSTVGVIAP